MAVTSARSIVTMKEKGHFEHEKTRINKYTLGDELPQQLSQLALRPRAMAVPYTLRKLTPKDREGVIDFMRRFFFRDEPLNLTINLLETPESRCYELEDYTSSSLADGASVAAVDDNGQFVGMVINGVVRREVESYKLNLTNFPVSDRAEILHTGSVSMTMHVYDKHDLMLLPGLAPDETPQRLTVEVDYTDKSDECPHPKFKRILRLLGHLDREARIWDKLPSSCHTAVEIRIASTHSDWRGRGLMRVLCEETERIAKEIGAGALRMDTTSAFSAAAAERLNYKSVYGLYYSDLDYAPHPDPPHLEARVYLKEL